MAETTGAAVQIPSSSDSNEPIPITSQEEKELRRVFERMCDFSAKSKYKDNIHELKAKIAICRAGGREQDSEALTEEIARMRQKIKEVEAKEQKLISCQDVMEMLILLGENPTQEEVEKMVWEVDEDLDMKVSWSEMRLMFKRNLRDDSGLEPSDFFHLSQFLIYDHNENNRVSVDETMNMLYARYGRGRMEEKLRELFGENMHETGREGGEITFREFLTAVQKVQMQNFWVTTKGRIIAQTAGGKKELNILTIPKTQLRAIHKKPGGKKALHAATTKLAEGKITMADYMSKAERIAKAGAKEAK